jgi:hypothetical protein
MDDKTLEYVLLLKDEMSGKLADVEKHVQGLDNKIKGVHKGAHESAVGGIKEMVTGFMELAVVEKAVEFIGEFLNSSKEAYNESAQACAQLNATMEATHNIANLNREALDAQSAALMRTTLFDDDDITRAQSVLGTFTSIKDKVYMDAIPAITDLATKMGGDLQGATVQIGKALNDPIQGMNALRRVGVSFSDNQKVVIKRLQETGHLAEAQAIILKELQTEFGNSAKAAAEAGTGALIVMQHRFQNIKEVIGEGVVSMQVFGAKAVETFISKNYGITFERVEEFLKEKLPIALVYMQKAVGAVLAFIAPIAQVIFANFHATHAAVKRVFDTLKSFGGSGINIFSILGKVVGFLLDKMFFIAVALYTAISYLVQFYGMWLHIIKKVSDFVGITAVIKDAWNLLTQAFQWTYENVIQPMIAGLKEAGDWLSKLAGTDTTVTVNKEEGKQEKSWLDGLLGEGGAKVPAVDGLGKDIAPMATGSKATGTKATTINITIENLGKEITIQTTNLKEGTAQVKNMISNMLAEAVNDSQILIGH